MADVTERSSTVENEDMNQDIAEPQPEEGENVRQEASNIAHHTAIPAQLLEESPRMQQQQQSAGKSSQAYCM